MRVAPFLAILFCFASSGFELARAATEIPFTFQAGLIWLKVNVASQSAPLNFLLDSGAGRSVVDLRTAQRLGVALGSRETVLGVEGPCDAYRVTTLAATVSSVPVPRDMLALDLSSISAGLANRIDGLLGADFFRGRIIQIDFAAQKIRLLDRNELTAAEMDVLPIAFRNDAFCVRVGVNGGAPRWMRFDTGCSEALEWVTSGAGPRGVGRTSIAAAAGAGSSKQVHTDVLLGSERIPEVKTGVRQNPIFEGESGLLGNGLLSRFLVTVDIDKSRLLLKRLK